MWGLNIINHEIRILSLSNQYFMELNIINHEISWGFFIYTPEN